MFFTHVIIIVTSWSALTRGTVNALTRGTVEWSLAGVGRQDVSVVDSNSAAYRKLNQNGPPERILAPFSVGYNSRHELGLPTDRVSYSSLNAMDKSFALNVRMDQGPRHHLGRKKNDIVGEKKEQSMSYKIMSTTHQRNGGSPLVRKVKEKAHRKREGHKSIRQKISHRKGRGRNRRRQRVHSSRQKNNNKESRVESRQLDPDENATNPYPGFDLFFSSNTQVVLNFQMKFDPLLPKWVKGTMIRNGPGQFEMGHRMLSHLFDGFAKLARWHFLGDGEVTFSTRFVETHLYQDSVATDDIAPYLLFQNTDPAFSLTDRAQALMHGIDNTNVNVHRFKGQFVAVSDFWKVYHFDGDTLETYGRIDPILPESSNLHKYFPVPSTSHPLQEHNSTSHITFMSLLSPVPFFSSSINLVRITSAEERHLIASISRSSNDLPYMHSFALSEHYAVLFAPPLFINTWEMLETGEPVESLDWNPQLRTDVYVIRLADGEITSMDLPAMIHMHQVNSYEQAGSIIVDYIVYPDIKTLKSFQLNILRDSTKHDSLVIKPKLKRFIINLSLGVISQEDFPVTIGMQFVNNLDMPAINPLYKQKRYCYVWGLVTKADGVHLGEIVIVKKDLCRPGNDRMWKQTGHYPVEPQFVGEPGSDVEDAGLILSVVLDGAAGRSYMAVLDARTLHLVSKAYMPHAIPFSLHGHFFPDEE